MAPRARPLRTTPHVSGRTPRTRGERPTRERILDAAEARFAQVGYGATSVNDVADDVGVRTPSLYKHFESKHALYVAVLERLLDPYVELLGGLLRVPETKADGVANLRTVVEHYLATPNLARLVQHATLAGGEELALLEARWFSPLFARAAALTPHDDAPAGLDPATLVAVFHAMLSGTVTLAPLHARLIGRDPVSPRGRDALLALMTGLVAELWDDGRRPAPPVKPPVDARPPSTSSAASARTAGATNRSSARPTARTAHRPRSPR